MRVPLPFGAQPSIKLIDTMNSGPKGFSIQNPTNVDVYYSDDQRTLDTVPASFLPQVGHILPAATPPLPPVIYPIFEGKLFARAQNAGAQVEIIIYDILLPVTKSCG